MSDESSFVNLMLRLRAGDQRAAAEIFEQFQARLIALARSRLDAQVRRKEDPEDVVQSAFRTFLRRAKDGQFDVENRERLWSLLTVITLRKCGHHIDYFRAARRDVRREAAPPPGADDSAATWDAIAREPTPDEVVMLTETIQQLMSDLKERDRKILELALQGEPVPEISLRVGYSERTVERTLERVRKKLEEMRAKGD
jgi:RNA polymerase sigma-70 factor (ECF subfamily)